jgi:hypothetical protein
MNTKATSRRTVQHRQHPFAQNLKMQHPQSSRPRKKQSRQRPSPHRAIGAGTQRRIDRLPHRNGRFHNYSFGNILGDRPTKAGRNPRCWPVCVEPAWPKVKKGERGIRILAPVIGIRRKKDSEAEKDIRTQNQAVLVGFRSAYVFDVSQTEGKDLPELSERV